MFQSIVVGRSGESIAGALVEKSFTIRSTFGAAVTFQSKDIRWIHFKNPPNVELDEIWAAPDDRVRGKIQGKAIRLKVAGGQIVRIPYTRIHTIIVNQEWDPSKGLPK